MHIRRAPPKGQASPASRAAAADSFMAESTQAILRPCRLLYEAQEDQSVQDKIVALAKVCRGPDHTCYIV